MNVGLLVKRIKNKKELAGIADSLVIREIDAFFRRHPHFKRDVGEKSESFKKIVKGVRAELRIKHGQFIRGANHISVDERENVYPTLYKRIFSITSVPKKIVDIGCGLNPESYDYLGASPIYVAYDLSEDVCRRINKFFRGGKINGECKQIDLMDYIEDCKGEGDTKIENADIAFLFKLVDAIEAKRGHKRAELLFKKIPTRWLVVSFATITLSGKSMRHPYRGWIERLCERLGWFYTKLLYDNEIFYIIKKN